MTYRKPDLSREEGIVQATSLVALDQWIARGEDEYLDTSYDYGYGGEVVERIHLDTWAVAHLIQAERVRAFDLGVASGLVEETANVFEVADAPLVIPSEGPVR